MTLDVIENENAAVLEESITELRKQYGPGQKVLGEDCGFLIEAYADIYNKPLQDYLVTETKSLTEREYRQELKKAQKRIKVRELLGRVPQTVQDFIAIYAKKFGIEALANHTFKTDGSYTYEGEETTPEEYNKDNPLAKTLQHILADNEIRPDRIMRDLRLIRDEYGLGYRDQSIEDAFDKWAVQKRKERRVDCYMELEYDNTAANKANWQKLVQSIVDEDETSKLMAECLLKKFIWQVKRKMAGLPVFDHLMVVLHGQQGSGKTVFVRKFLEPLQELTAPSTFHDVMDNRIIDVWEMSALFIDEMEGAARKDIDGLKRIITAEYLNRRPMRTNTVVKIPNNVTFIGATNKRLEEMIRDTTGLRRFAELVALNKMDWDTINEIDYKALWKALSR